MRLIPLLAFLSATAGAAGLPASIDRASLGRPSFEEDFARFDAGVDQARPARPHRWRTVAGNGGPFSEANRMTTRTSFMADRDFAGIVRGASGPAPLGLDPFVWEPGRALTILGQRTPAAVQPLVWNKPYFGGMLSTKFSFFQRFGYFEIEAKLPAGKGFWPAFWLMPLTGQWPKNGELDVFEGLGDPRIIYCTVHSGVQKQVQTKVALPFDASAGFHRYGTAWGRDEIVWYVDGREVARTATPADMKDQPMYLLIDLAIGGGWGGFPDESTNFPGRYVLRRVTVWPLPHGR